MRTIILAATLLPFCAIAQSADDRHWFGFLGSYTSPDSSRDADYSAGFYSLYGMPLGKRFAVEFGLLASVITHESDEEHDFQYSLGSDLLYQWNRGGFSPFLLVGVGAIFDDVRREEEISAFGNVGAGFKMKPLPAKIAWPMCALTLA